MSLISSHDIMMPRKSLQERQEQAGAGLKAIIYTVNGKSHTTGEEYTVYCMADMTTIGNYH